MLAIWTLVRMCNNSHISHCCRDIRQSTVTLCHTTHKELLMLCRPSCSVLHSLHVLSIFYAAIYVLVALCVHFHLHPVPPGATPSSSSCCSVFSRFPHCLPVPHSSICPLLNQLNRFLLLNPRLASAGLQSYLSGNTCPLKHTLVPLAAQSFFLPFFFFWPGMLMSIPVLPRLSL